MTAAGAKYGKEVLWTQEEKGDATGWDKARVAHAEERARQEVTRTGQMTD